MSHFIPIIHWLAGVVVLAEALNKLERTTPFAPNLPHRKRLSDGFKTVAWTLMALGAGSALMAPVIGDFGLTGPASQMLSHAKPSVAETASMLGFAVHIIYARLKEPVNERRVAH